MAQIHALTPEGRLPSQAVAHVQELAGDALGTIPDRTAPIQKGADDGFAVTDQEGRVAFSVESGGAVKIGNTSHEEDQPGYRVMDRDGQVAFEVTPDGRTRIYDGDGGSGQGVTEWHVFVAAGQSNMKGHAQPYGPGMDDPDPRIAQYGVTRRVIETATVPMDFYPDPVGVSPAWFFARHYLATQPAHVGVLLIPCAKGGTGFNDGTGTGGTWDDRQVTPGVIDLYGESITQTQEALAAAGDAGILKGVLWHQGESDANRAAAYEEQLDRLIGKYRTDLGDSALPFVVGQMTPEGNAISPGKTAVDAVHQATPARLQYTGLATSPWGATNYTDTTHFSRTGVEHLGREYVRAYHRALANRSGFGPQQPQDVQATFINGTLTIQWGQQPRRVTSYRVEYRIDGGAWIEVTREYPMNLSETITGLTGSVAEARVTSVNLAQEQAQLYPAIAAHVETVQDTGYRDVSAWVPDRVSGRLLIKRTGLNLVVVLDELVLSVDGQVEVNRFPPGLRPAFRIRYEWFPSTGGAQGGTVNISGGGYCNIYDVVAGQAMTARLEGEFPEGYAFPDPIPGNPA